MFICSLPRCSSFVVRKTQKTIFFGFFLIRDEFCEIIFSSNDIPTEPTFQFQFAPVTFLLHSWMNIEQTEEKKKLWFEVIILSFIVNCNGTMIYTRCWVELKGSLSTFVVQEHLWLHANIESTRSVFISLEFANLLLLSSSTWRASEK